MNTSEGTRPILVADDDDISRLILVETLEQAGFKTVAVADGAAALDAIVGTDLSLALLDVDMPHLDGYDVCRAVRSAKGLEFLPIVIITGHDDAGSITQAYDAGATDFISKPVNWTLLPHRVRYILRNAEVDRSLRHLAYHDPLTDLPNGQALGGLVAAAIADAGRSRTDEGVALLHLGIPACGRIGSIFGPDAGSAAVKAFAARLKSAVAEAVRPPAYTAIARIDGDRFAVCLRAAAIRRTATRLADAIGAAFGESVKCRDHQFFLPPAVGIAFYPEHGREPESLIAHAAAAKLYALRTDATSPMIYSNEIGNRAREGLALEAALRDAVRAERLTLYFQPKIRLRNDSLAGVEALLRWCDPEHGDVSPSRFIPLAEESGLILDVGRWLIQAACRQVMNWRSEGLETTVAVNVSARQFAHDDPAEIIRESAAACGIAPESLVVEITESALIADMVRVQAGLAAVRSLGCRVAIDDFGTGYSSLAYLKGLPVDELKIDRSFVRSLGSDSVDGAICAAVLTLARTLGLTVTAEGVETDAQLEWLCRHRCDEVQGFLIARPMSAREVLARYADAQPRHLISAG